MGKKLEKVKKFLVYAKDGLSIEVFKELVSKASSEYYEIRSILITNDLIRVNNNNIAYYTGKEYSDDELSILFNIRRKTVTTSRKCNRCRKSLSSGYRFNCPQCLEIIGSVDDDSIYNTEEVVLHNLDDMIVFSDEDLQYLSIRGNK